MTPTAAPLDIAIATCLTLPEPDPDQAPLDAALDAAGISSRVVPWDAPAGQWPRARISLIRSTWNYALNRPAYLTWAEQAARTSTLLNPLPVVRWNSHKGYLLELEQAGIPVAPTVLVRRGAPPDLAPALDRGWQELVVKPAVSASSYRTRRFGRGERAGAEAHLEALLRDGDALVQRYLESVEGYGERAVVWIDGEVTHAVRKRPRFEGQDESVSEAKAVSEAERALAGRALAAAPGGGSGLLYGRVDMAPGPDGDPVVMELELLEPSLFFPQRPAALSRYVAGLRRVLDQG